MPSNAAPDPEQPISRDVLLDVRLPQGKDTHRIEVRRIKMVPGHAATAFMCTTDPSWEDVVDGSVSFQVEGEAVSVLGPGDLFFEPEGARIVRFDARDDGVTFLAYFLLGPGQRAIGFPDG